MLGVPARSCEANDVGACIKVDNLGESEVGGKSACVREDEEREEEGTKENEGEEGWNGPVQFMHESSKREDEEEDRDSVDKEDVAWELVAGPPVLRDHEYNEERELGSDRHNRGDHPPGVEL